MRGLSAGPASSQKGEGEKKKGGREGFFRSLPNFSSSKLAGKREKKKKWAEKEYPLRTSLSSFLPPLREISSRPAETRAGRKKGKKGVRGKEGGGVVQFVLTSPPVLPPSLPGIAAPDNKEEGRNRACIWLSFFEKRRGGEREGRDSHGWDTVMTRETARKEGRKEKRGQGGKQGNLPLGGGEEGG